MPDSSCFSYRVYLQSPNEHSSLLTSKMLSYAYEEGTSLTLKIVLNTMSILFSDPPNGGEWEALDDGLAYGTDMVTHIRQEFGNTFTICVAGKWKSIFVVLSSIDKMKILLCLM